MDTIV